MGASSSTPLPVPAPRTALRGARRSRYPSLASTGRYALLRDPATSTPIHVLGVYPCSPLSEEEAHDLVEAVRPGALYLDVHPELAGVLQGDVREKRTLAQGWRVPSDSPSLRLYDGAGVLASVWLRNVLADNEFMALVGAETLGAYKAGLAAAGAAAAGGAAAPAVLAFPFPMDHRFGETLMRPLDYAAVIVGEAGVGSSRVTVMAGNPHGVLSAPGAPGAPAEYVAEVEHAVALPPGGYFTRQDVAALASTFRAAVTKASAAATVASCDMDKDLTDREAAARELGDTTTAEAFAARAVAAQATSCAVAYTLQRAAGGLAEGAGAGPGAGGPGAATGGVVALVNLGGMGCLLRNFEHAKEPAAALPPFTLGEQAGVLVVPSVVVGGLGWGLRALGRRFPRTAVGVGVMLGGTVGSAMYMMANADWARYGVSVRRALANPRTVSPLARIK